MMALAAPSRVGLPTRSTPLPANAARLAARRTVVVRANLFDQIGKAFTQGKQQFTINQAGKYDEAKIKADIDTYIKENKVVVFSWTGCPYCKRAKGLLSDLGANFKAVELDTMPEGNAIRAELTKLTGRTSVPNIWIAGKNIGGCSEGPGVVPLHDRGELVPMLQAAGAL